MPLGYCCLVLHAHLPYVRHPEYSDPLEERWFYEAVSETYLPLLRLMDDWDRDGLDWRLTVSLSPTLMAMFDDPLLRQRCQAYLGRLVELADRECERTRDQPELNPTARLYREQFGQALEDYTGRHQLDLTQAFARFQTGGHLELLTCSATHAFLPLMQHQPTLVRAQIQLATEDYQKRFGQAPVGIWLSECGYYPELDVSMREAGLRYFFVDAHGMLYAAQRPKYGVFAPVFCPSGVAAFGRDPATSRSVWSAEEGYPGDPLYREFYRDIGYDLEQDYIAPYIHESGLRVPTGFKYHRITGPVALGEKEPYDPAAARARAAEHASDFVFKREEQLRQLASMMDRPPLIVSPYDAELFGHWWFEGLWFLDGVMRGMCAMRDVIEPLSPTQYLARHGMLQVLTPSFSSWGSGGYSEVWLNEKNDWIYPKLNVAGNVMIKMAQRYRGSARGRIRRILNQMARELLLAQSSDWAFIIRNGTVADYATRRTEEHIANFHALSRMLTQGPIDESRLVEFETRHSLFPALEFEVFAP